MTISERIFDLISKKGFTQKEFSRRTGIAESTISDWKKKGTNPVSDKILSICEVLEVSPYFLLSGKEKSQLSYTDIKPWASEKKKDSAPKDKKNGSGKDTDKHDSKEDKKPAAAAVKKDGAEDAISKLPEIATIASDDSNYNIKEEKDDNDAVKDSKADKAKPEKKETKTAKK